MEIRRRKRASEPKAAVSLHKLAFADAEVEFKSEMGSDPLAKKRHVSEIQKKAKELRVTKKDFYEAQLSELLENPEYGRVNEHQKKQQEIRKFSNLMVSYLPVISGVARGAGGL